MKKNAMLKIAAILLVAVLLTTCAISATFAKYVTSDEFDPVSARVAKWGVTVQADVDANVFKNSYEYDSKVVVKGESDAKVIAPGTKFDNAITLKVTGKPEVMVNVEADFGLTLTGFDAYCPIIINVKTGTAAAVPYKVDGSSIANAAALVDAVNEAVNDAFNADNTAAGTTLDKTVTIGWEWPYSTSAENDVNDTALGDAGTATIAFEGSLTVTQVGGDYAA